MISSLMKSPARNAPMIKWRPIASARTPNASAIIIVNVKPLLPV